MMRRMTVFTALLLLIGATAQAATNAHEAAGGARSAVAFAVAHSQNAAAVPAFEIFEITFVHEHAYENPWLDASIDVTFVAPDKREMKVGGFHYGSLGKPRIVVHGGEKPGQRRQVEYIFDADNIWKARFAPSQIGRWTYSYEFRNAAGQKAGGAGAFECIKGRQPNRGFVRQDPKNPYRWVFDDGSPYFPIGLQECLADNAGAGSVLATAALEGPFRLDRGTRPDPPPGALFTPGPAMNPQNGDTYFGRYARAGFNLFRFSQQNCSFSLTPDLNRYLAQESIMTDELLAHARKYGFRIMHGIFGFMKAYNDQAQDAEGMERVRRFIKYSVDRWGAYVDFWEFLNEQKASDDWYAIVVPYLETIDPYAHPITTSWERPELPGIDLSAPHWYDGNRNALESDRATTARAKEWKRHGKPVIVGEQGNSAPREQLRDGVGGVWDPGSAERMRLRNWSALFNEISFVFWNTSYAKDGHYMNIWLGPLERQYVRAMQDFAYCFDSGVRMAEAGVSDPRSVRAYGLADARRAGAYLHHFKDHEGAVRAATVTLEVPQAAKGYWYAPENGAILKAFDAPAGRQTFEAPAFTIDLALIVTPDAPPDSDRDGRTNDVDPDDDNDGVADEKDAFPLEPFEWADKDGDLIGDNLDADVDADGIGDDKNTNGQPDHEEMDIDGDGVPRAEAAPWDAFPDNPKESRDTDGDGIGDNADPDDDGDGFTDAEEEKAGADPLDRISVPRSSAS